MISVPRYEIALWLLDIARRFLKIIGLSGNGFAQAILYAAPVLTVALSVSYGLRNLALFIARCLPIFTKK